MAPAAGPNGGSEFYLYYKTCAIDAEAVTAAVLAFQRALRRSHPPLLTRLLRREAGGVVTWMETYALSGSDPVASIDGGLRASIVEGAAEIGSLIVGNRHLEVFAPVMTNAGTAARAMEIGPG